MGRLGEHGLVGGLRSVFLPKRAALLEVHALLERVGVEDKLFQRTDTLSGGQSQRVAIARALYQRPAVLLCDEPVASVDPARAQAVVELLVEVARERGLALVVSLHDLDLARAHFPRIVGLRAGRVVFDARTSDVASARFDELYRLDEAELLSDGA
jgi:phosphonate transport system ATP-binding protein